MKDTLEEKFHQLNIELDAQYQRTHCSHPKYTEKSIALGLCVHCRGESAMGTTDRFFGQSRLEDQKINSNNGRL